MNNNSIICPHCGAKNSATAQFCGNCGKSLQGIQPTQETQTKSSSHKHIVRNSIILLSLLAVAIAAGIVWSKTLPKSVKHHTSTTNVAKITNSSKKKSHNSKTETKELDQLSSSDLKKLGIKFQIQQYIGVQSLNARLFIELANPTNKEIQIFPNKISSNIGDLYLETGSTTITLQPKAKRKSYLVYGQVLGKEISDILNSDGYWIYGKNNLELQKLSNTEKLKNDNSQPNRKGDGYHPSADSDSSSIASSSSSSSQSTQSITSGTQAIAAVQANVGNSIHGVPVSWSIMGTTGSNMSTDDNGNKCYWVRGKRSTDSNMSSYDSLDYYVYPNGNVVPRDGNNYSSDADSNDSSSSDSDDSDQTDDDTDDNTSDDDENDNNTTDTNDDADGDTAD
ncbi:zinc ribbon domain-containing protein [Furfurilactobacillus rossiae]|uniref:DUF7577 domain-containing protein n=1 Tax=Furfurilactobacillus rossiae DSM 15814 TaxID=1114972 RepID=A0A0R1RU18_9LACO|nr:zinc ribbon domain-containing protein [Furfurilactobacillus rossiae]KRL56568.1 hypothetical protein FD35_GL001662 [Furfurilactobacillus rossiae DSM 15814]QFR66527.1 zinc-ribbon domain-containing protein [Furfurilactobacillus rossiae]QLE61992.1 Dentin sialophosphoprotein precursor [Furfurilactobacillus rossiae]